MLPVCCSVLFFADMLPVVGDIPCFVNPEMSASQIASTNRSLYDVFGLPCSLDSYVPNSRLRELISKYESFSCEVNDDVRSFEHSLRLELKSLHTWKYSSGGSESKICDPNLAHFLTMINNRVSVAIKHSAVKKDSLHFKLALAKQRSKPEHRIEWKDFVLMGSEAKGVEHSVYEALIQGMELGGDAAVHMWRCGLSTELAVVPVVLSIGDCFCIYAVYLIPDCYPVIVQLSPPLSYLTLEGRCCIARWGIVLAQFAVETTQHLMLQANVRDKIQQVRQEQPLGLYIAHNLFFKPLRDYHKSGGGDSSECVLDVGSHLRTNLELLMLAYNRIHVVENARDYFLFPLGVVSYPSEGSPSHSSRIRDVMDACISKHFLYHLSLVRNGCPVIVYDELDGGSWSNDKPPEDLVDSYIDCVANAVNVLNAAKIAHMDLRPGNILWRRTECSTVQIQLIDLEDAIPFGFYIRFADILRRDSRYPVFDDDDRELIPAGALHNDWFNVTVAAWARQTDIDGYSDYMYNNHITFRLEFAQQI